MLARSAQGLYWIGRYLERADHLCRLMRLQTGALVDRPSGEIYSGWHRIYRSINRQPPGGNLGIEHPDHTPVQHSQQSDGVREQVQAQGQLSDEYTLADSFTLTDDLTFERSNPSSVWSCFAMGRENARQMRHCISGEMWTSLNLAYLRLQQVTILDIWPASPEAFYSETAQDIDTFMGVASATMYRDEGWHFMQLGRYIERSQLACDLLSSQLEIDALSSENLESDWSGLLRMYHALDTYSRTYSVEIYPEQVLDLLVTDPLLPVSLRRSLETMATELAAVGLGPYQEGVAAANRLAGRLGALVVYDWPDTTDRSELLANIAGLSHNLHNLINSVYFDYQVEAAAVR